MRTRVKDGSLFVEVEDRSYKTEYYHPTGLSKNEAIQLSLMEVVVEGRVRHLEELFGKEGLEVIKIIEDYGKDEESNNCQGERQLEEC